VVSIRLCRYARNRLVRDVTLAPSMARQLAGVFDALKPPTAVERRQFSSCFLYTNPVIAIVSYADGRVLDVYTNTHSCVFPSNGAIYRINPPGRRAQLISLLLRDTRS
jgi:hypothetical protein